jgi:hypothetical protein
MAERQGRQDSNLQPPVLEEGGTRAAGAGAASFRAVKSAEVRSGRFRWAQIRAQPVGRSGTIDDAVSLHRIPGVGDIDSGEAFGTPGIQVQTRLLAHWGFIAIDQEQLAHSAREAYVEREAAGEPGHSIDNELKPAIIGVAAAAHGLDALYGEIRELALPEELRMKWKDACARPARPRQIHEALKHGFKISAQRWFLDLDWLFDLRDFAVHPVTSFGAPAEHPAGFHAAKEYGMYTCEAATRAVDLLLDVVRTCSSSPKEPLLEWAENAKRIARNFQRVRDPSSMLGD